MRVLIAPDNFKGSLTAAEAASALADGWRAGWPVGRALEIEMMPLADGGEGTTEAMLTALGGQWVQHTVADPLGRPVEASYGLIETGGARLAIMEMSAASGYLLVSAAERDLLRSNTVGTGELIRHALTESGAQEIIIGIGGSATNDGGTGMASALGWRFLDAAGRAIFPLPGSLSALVRIEPPAASLPPVRIIAAYDVNNPLLGRSGATCVYGPQKGLRSEAETLHLEAGLTRLADVTTHTLSRDCRDLPGAGAAGGLGFGLMAFCGAELQAGFDLVAETIGLPAAVARADVVLTGEGSLDHQTLAGKTPAGVATLARRFGKRVIAFAGRVEADARPALETSFHEVIALLDAEPSLSPRQCMDRGPDLLRRHAALLAARIAAEV